MKPFADMTPGERLDVADDAMLKLKSHPDKQAVLRELLTQQRYDRDWFERAESDPDWVIDRMRAMGRAMMSPFPTTTGLGRDLLLRWGSWSWPCTYKIRNDDDFASSVAAQIRELRIPEPERQAYLQRIGARRDRDFLDTTMQIAGAARWIDGAATTLTTSHKMFAALASTRIAAESYEDIQIPWPAFMVTVPPGILTTSEGVDYRYVFFFVLRGIRVSLLNEGGAVSRSNLCGLFLLNDQTAEMLSSFKVASDAVHQVLFEDLGADGSISSEESRLVQSAKRAVVGLLYTLQYTDNFKQTHPSATRRSGDNREGPPPHRNIFVGRPISYDCRPALAQYHRQGGSNAPPSVQSLVRGHYKRQVIGVGRNGRKVIWVEPYWRGPEDAPILSHPYRVGA